MNNARKRKRLIVVKKKRSIKKALAANIFGIKTSTSSFFKINTIDKDLVELKKEKKEIEMYVFHCFYQHIFPQNKITFQ